MARLVVALGAVLLIGLMDLQAENSCDIYAAVGQDLTLPFAYSKLGRSHVLRWTQNSSIVFSRQQGRVLVGKPADISSTGSLLLQNIQFSSAGLYQANVLHPNNTPAASWIGHLCVLDRVVKPQLTYTCDFKSSSVDLNCYVANTQGLVFSWTNDEKALTRETGQKLKISLKQLKGNTSFTCSVANKARSKEKSNTIYPSCESPPAPALHCFTFKTLQAAVAGAAGLILLLISIIVILCCCLVRHKTQKRMRDDGELRMLSVRQKEPDPISPEYETMHQTRNSPPLNREPSPGTCYENISQPEAQSENRLSHLSTAAEGHSPVPKPRTKVPQKANM